MGRGDNGSFARQLGSIIRIQGSVGHDLNGIEAEPRRRSPTHLAQVRRVKAEIGERS